MYKSLRYSSTSALHSIEGIYQVIDRYDFRQVKANGKHELCGFIDLHLKDLNTNLLKRFKNKLIRKYQHNYVYLVSELRPLCQDPWLFDVIFYRHSGTKQYSAFVKACGSIIDDTTLDVAAKKLKFYKLIELQHALYPNIAKASGILLPDTVHRWFWYNLPKNESFHHFYSLIKSDVILSTPHGSKLMNRLLQGSEMEQQLATFQIFLHEEANHPMFYNKFTKLYNFYMIKQATNFLISHKNFKFIKLYLSALLSRLETHELTNSTILESKRKILSIKFTNTLLHYLSKSDDPSMFLETFSTLIDLLKTTSKDAPLELLHTPFVLSIRYLRIKGHHEKVFKMISMADSIPFKKNFKFTQLLLGELVSTLRSFNDPKITCSYIISAYKNKSTVPMLNNLGLWSLIYHNTLDRLTEQQLIEDLSRRTAWKAEIPLGLRKKTLPDNAVLTELYRIVLDRFSKDLSSAEFHHLVLGLYNKYKHTMLANQGKFHSWRLDCGVISVFLYYVRYQLKDNRLAFKILQDFYSSSLKIKNTTNSGISPFAIVMYHNYELSQTEISSLLMLMHNAGVPLDFKTIVSMIFRLLKLNNVKDAHAWYKRLLSARFELKHFDLIQVVKKYNWELPSSFDKSLLDVKENSDRDGNSSGMLFDESNDDDVMIDEYYQEADDQDFAGELVTLLENIRGL